MEEVRDRIERLLNETSEETRRLIAKVFEIERERLYKGAPTGVDREIAEAVKEIVK